MIFSCYMFAGASIYYYICCKSTLSALGFMVCFVLMLLSSGCWALEDNHPRAMRWCSALGGVLAALALGYGIFYGTQLTHNARHLFFTAVPRLGYLMLFVLQLCLPPKKVSEKTGEEG